MSDIQTIYGLVPSKSNSYRISDNRLYKTAALSKYEATFYIQCNKYRNANIEGYFEFYIDVYYPNQRSDLDGVFKVVLDCLQKVKAISNDNKAVLIHARKFLDKESPRIEFRIETI